MFFIRANNEAALFLLMRETRVNRPKLLQSGTFLLESSWRVFDGAHSPAPAALDVFGVAFRALPQYRPLFWTMNSGSSVPVRKESTEVPCFASSVSFLPHGDAVTGLFCSCFSFLFLYPDTNPRWCLTRDVAFLVFSFFMIMVWYHYL